MSNDMKWSVSTKYRSDMMRSRLETKWAKTLDILCVEYYYEPQAYTFDDISYLPDFYLPQQGSFFEVKGVMDENDVRKINALARGIQRNIIIGYPNGTFQMVDAINCGENDPNATIEKPWWVKKSETLIVKCEKCKKWHFHNEVTYWKCRICGHHARYCPKDFYFGHQNLFEALGVSR